MQKVMKNLKKVVISDQNQTNFELKSTHYGTESYEQFPRS